MTAGVAASFASLADGPARLGLLLGVVFGLSAVLSLSLWCVAGLMLARALRTQAQWRALNIALGPPPRDVDRADLAAIISPGRWSPPSPAARSSRSYGSADGRPVLSASR